MSNTKSPMAAKTAKARKMDMLEMRYIQSRGDAADYQRGRVVLPYGKDGKRGTQQAEWAKNHMLTPIERWAVENGYAKNPFEHQTVKAGSPKYVVYYTDGKRHVSANKADIMRHFVSSVDAVRMWDGEQFVYAL